MELNRENVVTFPENFQGTRIALFSFWNKLYEPLSEIARPNWKAYCERHNYALRFYPNEYQEDPNNLRRYGDKGKWELFHDIRGHADIVMFLDIDSLFMNLDVRIEDILSRGSARADNWTFGADGMNYRTQPNPNRRFAWTHDDNGPLSGLFIARTDDVTTQHLRYAYERAAIENNVRHGKIEPNGISDQDSMTRLMNIPPFRSTFSNCFPAKSVGHCFPDNWEEGDWICGFPGHSAEEKRILMSNWRKKINDGYAIR